MFMGWSYGTVSIRLVKLRHTPIPTFSENTPSGYVLLFSGSQFWSNPRTANNNSPVRVLGFPKIYPKIMTNFRAKLNIKWCFFWDLHQLEFWANFDSSCFCSYQYIPKGFKQKQNCWVLYIKRNLVWTDCPWTFFDPWRDKESVIQRWKTPVKLTFWTGDFYLFEKGSHLSHPPSWLWVPKMFILRAVLMHVPCPGTLTCHCTDPLLKDPCNTRVQACGWQTWG